MEEILINCAPGVSGDMLLGALYDLGVPKSIFEKPLCDMGLEKLYSLNFSESNSCSIRGIRVEVKIIERSIRRDWKSIKELIIKGNLEQNLEKRIYSVFELLAEAEGKVHGINPEDVHFHEIGAIDSLVDIVGVCAAIEYLKPKNIYCSPPTLGRGFVDTEHGSLSIPSPAVIELLSKGDLKVYSDFKSIDVELSTPTGIALLSNLISSLKQPSNYSINSYGVGLGSKKLQYPNLLRVLKISSFIDDKSYTKTSPRFEEISVQEAWIDDQTPEDISAFVKILRNEGAYDVSFQPINMKKDRQGFSIKVVIPIDKEEYFRELWFHYSSTIGLRERKQGRWILPRRCGECLTSYGKIKFKQTINPNGRLSIKPEHSEISRLQSENNLPAKTIRKIIEETMGEFEAFEDWK